MTTTRTAIFVPSTRSLVKVTAHGVSSESCRDKAAHCADRRKLWSQHLDSVKCLHRLTGPARMFAIAKYSRMVRSRRWLSANNRVDVSIPGRNRSLIPLLSFDELPSASRSTLSLLISTYDESSSLIFHSSKSQSRCNYPHHGWH